MSAAYQRASLKVSRLSAPPGFADASTFLARAYADQADFYAATLKLGSGSKTAEQDPYGVMKKMQNIGAALQHFDIDLTQSRRAFKEATANANIAYPHWIAVLINGASGGSGSPTVPQFPDAGQLSGY